MVGWFVCVLGEGGFWFLFSPIPSFVLLFVLHFCFFAFATDFLVVLTFATSFDGCGNFLLQFGKFWVEIINACVGM